jgi:hypothetical protein
MARCRYCGQSAGWLRGYHAQCRQTHEDALTTIPRLLHRAVHSEMAAARFAELLQEGARSSFVTTQQLAEVVATTIGNILEEILARELITTTQEARIIEVVSALGISFSDIPQVDEKLFKIEILRDLEGSRATQRVSVVGDLPFELGRDEAILWIFNGVGWFRGPYDGTTPPSDQISSPALKLPYHGWQAYQADPAKQELSYGGTVDVVTTNRNLILVDREGAKSVQLARIHSVVPYADSVHIRQHKGGKLIRLELDDPWFAANLISGLLRLSAKSAGAHDSGA